MLCPKEQGSTLWGAAFYEQDTKKSKQTHGHFPRPVKGVVVPASTMESCGTDDGDIVKRKRHQGLEFPQLFVFLSINGGYGVYSLGHHRSGVYLTEYGGRVVGAKEARDLRGAGLHTHVRTLSSSFLELDGKLDDLFDVEYFAENGMVRLRNRFFILTI